MENVLVYSPIEDKGIQKNLNESPIWRQAYHQDELKEVSLYQMFEYSIKFDGLKPVMVNKVRKVVK